MNSARQAYSKLGFRLTGTGGNCTAFQKDLDCGLHILITEQDDEPCAPTEAAQPVTVGLYCGDGSQALAYFNAPDCDVVAYRLSNGLWEKC